MAYNKLTSLAANIEAIRTTHRLHQERRTAIAAERATLALYSGFGGIKEVLASAVSSRSATPPHTATPLKRTRLHRSFFRHCTPKQTPTTLALRTFLCSPSPTPLLTLSPPTYHSAISVCSTPTFGRKGGLYEQSTKTIHNYFFVKALELLNEGGLLAFVTTRGIADTPGNKLVRDHLTRHANLITALRLPDNLFAQSSGIEVGSDLLIWQKQSQKQGLSSREQLFLQTIREQAAPGLLAEPSNKLFTLPKTTLATESCIAANQFGKQVPVARHGRSIVRGHCRHSSRRL